MVVLNANEAKVPHAKPTLKPVIKINNTKSQVTRYKE